MSITFNLNNWGDVIRSKDFDDLLGKIDKNGVHEVNKEENPYHILINDIYLNDKYILVGLHGLVERNTVTPPAFYFRGISNKSEIGLISIADPSINLSKSLSLGWYLNNNINGNVTKEIASLLDKIIEKTGKKLIIAGGSGGGFAALNIHNHMELANQAISFAWNPQTDITKYNIPIIKKYFNVCVEQNTEINLDYIRNKLTQKKVPYIVDERKDLNQLILINGYDHAHLRKHIRRYFNNETKETKTRVFIGDWGNGHIQPDQKTIQQIISLIMKDLTFDDIIKLIPQPNKPALRFNENLTKLDNTISCRVSILKVGAKRIVCIKNNIYYNFMGFQTIVKVKNSFGDIVFDSNYLLGSNVGELYFESSIENIRKLNNAIIEIHVEDLYGSCKVFSFNFNEVKELHECNLKI